MSGLLTSTAVFIPDEEFVWISADLISVIENGVYDVRVNDPDVASNRAIKRLDLRHFESSLQTLPLQNDYENEYGVHDMCTLSHLHEASILDNLRRRFFTHQPYTRTGEICIAMNPYKWLPLYSKDSRTLYLPTTYNSQPPHVYSTSASAYYQLSTYRTNQSILVSGESGAGKTETVKILMNHFAYISQTHNHNTNNNTNINLTMKSGNNHSHSCNSNVTIVNKLLQANPLLESFGNAKTIRNDNSSRFGKFNQLQFNTQFELVGSQCMTYLLEKSRVVIQNPNERNYHIIYELLSAPMELQTLLCLNTYDMNEYEYICHGDLYTTNIEGISDSDRFHETSKILSLLGVDCSIQILLYELLAVILHMGQISFTNKDGDTDIAQIDNHSYDTITYICNLLQLNLEDFRTNLITRTILVEGNTVSVPLTIEQAYQSRDAIAKEIYARIFHWLVLVINFNTHHSNQIQLNYNTSSNTVSSSDIDCMTRPRSVTTTSIAFNGYTNSSMTTIDTPISHDGHTQTIKKYTSNTNRDHTAEEELYTISLLDIFGFESFDINRFEQLCINYANEKLQYKFTYDVLQSVLVEYEAEGLNIDHMVIPENTKEVLYMIESKQGLISVLTEECMLPKGTEDNYISKINKYWSTTSSYFIKDKFYKNKFTIIHYAGAVTYTVDSFIERNKDTLPYSMIILFTDERSCKHVLLSKLFKYPSLFQYQESDEVNAFLNGNRSQNCTFLLLNVQSLDDINNMESNDNKDENGLLMYVRDQLNRHKNNDSVIDNMTDLYNRNDNQNAFQWTVEPSMVYTTIVNNGSSSNMNSMNTTPRELSTRSRRSSTCTSTVSTLSAATYQDSSRSAHISYPAESSNTRTSYSTLCSADNTPMTTPRSGRGQRSNTCTSYEQSIPTSYSSQQQMESQGRHRSATMYSRSSTGTTTTAGSSSRCTTNPLNMNKSFMMQPTVSYKFQQNLSSLMTVIESTQVHYIRCIKPNRLKQSNYFDRKLVVEQLRSGGMIEAVKISRSTYPNRLLYTVFLNRYSHLFSLVYDNTPTKSYIDHTMDVRESCIQLIELLLPLFHNHMSSIQSSHSTSAISKRTTTTAAVNTSTNTYNSSSVNKDTIHYQYGHTKIYYSTPYQEFLEFLRNKCITQYIIRVQSRYRLYRCRKHYIQIKSKLVYFQMCLRTKLCQIRYKQLVLPYRKLIHSTVYCQSIYRRNELFKSYHRMRAASVYIQSYIRGYLTRKTYIPLIEQQRKCKELGSMKDFYEEQIMREKERVEEMIRKEREKMREEYLAFQQQQQQRQQLSQCINNCTTDIDKMNNTSTTTVENDSNEESLKFRSISVNESFITTQNDNINQNLTSEALKIQIKEEIQYEIKSMYESEISLLKESLATQQQQFQQLLTYLHVSQSLPMNTTSTSPLTFSPSGSGSGFVLPMISPVAVPLSIPLPIITCIPPPPSITPDAFDNLTSEYTTCTLQDFTVCTTKQRSPLVTEFNPPSKSESESESEFESSLMSIKPDNTTTSSTTTSITNPYHEHDDNQHINNTPLIPFPNKISLSTNITPTKIDVVNAFGTIDHTNVTPVSATQKTTTTTTITTIDSNAYKNNTDSQESPSLKTQDYMSSCKDFPITPRYPSTHPIDSPIMNNSYKNSLENTDNILPTTIFNTSENTTTTTTTAADQENSFDMASPPSPISISWKDHWHNYISNVLTTGRLEIPNIPDLLSDCQQTSTNIPIKVNRRYSQFAKLWSILQSYRIYLNAPPYKQMLPLYQDRWKHHEFLNTRAVQLQHWIQEVIHTMKFKPVSMQGPLRTFLEPSFE